MAKRPPKKTPRPKAPVDKRPLLWWRVPFKHPIHLRLGRTLAFTMQTQTQTQWCWSAVSVSVDHFYNSSSTWTQCSMANAELGQTTCCANGSSSACNKPWYLDRALTRVGRLGAFSNGVKSFADVTTEIGASHPLGVRIGWSGGGGHFVVISGWSSVTGTSQQFVEVRDPIYGSSTYSYATFQTAYQTSGSWTHSYTTRA